MINAVICVMTAVNMYIVVIWALLMNCEINNYMQIEQIYLISTTGHITLQKYANYFVSVRIIWLAKEIKMNSTTNIKREHLYIIMSSN